MFKKKGRQRHEKMANNKRFTTYTPRIVAYNNAEGKTQYCPYLIIEGNLTRDVELKSGKKAFYIFTSMGTGISAEEVFERANGHYDEKIKYNESTFFNLKFFGKTAERFSKVGKKGLGVLVWGIMKEETYKDAQGNGRTSIVIIVDNFKPLYKNNNENKSNNNNTSVANTAAEPENEDFEEDFEDEDIPF